MFSFFYRRKLPVLWLDSLEGLRFNSARVFSQTIIPDARKMATRTY